MTIYEKYRIQKIYLIQLTTHTALRICKCLVIKNTWSYHAERSPSPTPRVKYTIQQMHLKRGKIVDAAIASEKVFPFDKVGGTGNRPCKL